MATNVGGGWKLRYIRIGRILIVTLTLIATLLMGFTKESGSTMSYSSVTGVTTSTYYSVKSSDSSSFMYFVLVNAIVFLYSLIVTVISFIKKLREGLELPLLIGDLLTLIFLFTGNAAAAATEVVAYNGISSYGWIKFCNTTTTFCGIAMASNVLSSIAAALCFLTVVLSVINLHRRTIS